MKRQMDMARRFGQSTDVLNTPPDKSLGDKIKVIGSTAPDPYKEICDKLYALLTGKRDYYGCGDDPLSNALGVGEDGIEPAMYQLARIGEKRRRLHGQLTKDDRIETFMDIAGHAAVAIACLQRSD